MPSSSLVEVGVEVEVEVGVYILVNLELKQLDWQVHYFFRGGWVVGWLVGWVVWKNGE